MDSQRSEQFLKILPEYTQLIWQYDAELKALWYYLAPEPRPCFTPTLLAEIRDLQQRMAAHLRTSPNDCHYLVAASAIPKVFNLGGDLQLFAKLITERSRDELHRYARTCVDAVYANATNLGIPTLTTVSLIQGSALGGGFEAALSSHVVIAEEGSQMGFPEVSFNLFPGMGAYDLLTRRLNPAQAERLMRSGEVNDAMSLSKMGLVDVVAPAGEGIHATQTLLRRHSRSRNGMQAIQQVRQRVAPLDYGQLVDIVEIWVAAAMRLTVRDTRVMEKIAAAQRRKETMSAEAAMYRRPIANVHSLTAAAG